MKNARSVSLSRRVLLRGAGVAVGLPLLDAMLDGRGRLHNTAHAAAPVRLMTFFWPNGPRGSRWAPTATTLAANTLGACMSEAFAPVAGKPDIIPYLNVVTGLGQGDIWKSGHSCAMMAAGDGTADDHNNYGNWPTGPSIDQVCADKFGGMTRIPSLALSANVGAFNNTPGWAMISWKDGGRGIPPTKDPKAVWRQITGGVADPANPTAVRAAARRKALMDFLRDDTRKLQQRLGAADKQRVEQHVTSLQELSKLLDAPTNVNQSCDKPAEPVGLPVDVAMLKLIALAFKCDSTRYASFMLDVASGQRDYAGSPGGDHNLSHDADDATVIKRTNIKLGYLANFLRDLASIPEAGGTLLDNSLVYSNSDITDGRTHGREPGGTTSPGLPVIVAGRAGGLKAGRHVAVGKKRLSDLHCSLLNYAGVPSTKFGSNGTGPLPGF